MPQEKYLNGVQVSIDVGDITDHDTEAFVFYADSSLDLGSGFGNAIAMRGGLSIKKELESMDPISTGESVVTEAGLLKASWIIHANGPKFQEDDIPVKLKRTMLSALKAAETKSVKNLAFPAMGAGFYGIPPAECARVMFQSIEEHVHNNGTGLEKIEVLLLDKRQYQPFEAEFAKLETGE